MGFTGLRKRLGDRVRATVPPGERTFLFFSQLYRKEVVDSEGAPVGRIDDIVASLEETFPRVTALVAVRGGMERFPMTARCRPSGAGSARSPLGGRSSPSRPTSRAPKPIPRAGSSLLMLPQRGWAWDRNSGRP